MLNAIPYIDFNVLLNVILIFVFVLMTADCLRSGIKTNWW